MATETIKKKEGRMSKYDKLPSYTVLTSTHDYVDELFDQLSFKTIDGELHKIFGDKQLDVNYDNDAIDYIKENIGVLHPKKLELDSIIMNDSESSYEFEYNKLPKHTKSGQLYLIVQRQYDRHKFTYNYHIAHIMSPRDYWCFYCYDLDMWISTRIENVVAWYEIGGFYRKSHLQ
jgi:hypothetical protein